MTTSESSPGVRPRDGTNKDFRVSNGAPADEQIGILELLAIVLERRRIVLRCWCGAVLVGLLLHWALPARFRAESLVLVVPDANESQYADAGSLGMAALLGKTPSSGGKKSLISSVLASQLLKDSLVSRVAADLDVSDSTSLKRAIEKHLSFQAGEDGNSYMVRVEGYSAREVAAIANSVPAVVNRIATHITLARAVSKTRLLEEQLATARTSLESSERRLVEFQEASEAPALPEQAKSTLEAAAQLQQQIFEKEIAITSLRRSATRNNPALQSALAEVGAMREQLRRVTDGSDVGRVFVPMSKAPQLSAQASRVLRDYVKSERIYTALLASLADAQLSVQDDLPVLTALDVATVPTRPIGLPIWKVIGLASFLGIASGITAAFVVEYLRGARLEGRNDRFFRNAAAVGSRMSRFPRRRSSE